MEDGLIWRICSPLEGHAASEITRDTIASNRIRWDAILHRLHRTGLGPLFLRKAKRLGLDGHVPPYIAKSIAKERLSNMVWNTVLTTGYLEAIESLRDANIEVIALKGPFLSLLLYEDPSIRRSCDIDLLILEQNWQPAVESLARLGYAPPSGTAGDERLRSWRGEVTYTRRAVGNQDYEISIELHTSVVARTGWYDRVRRSQFTLFDHIVDIASSDRAVPYLSPPALLLHLVLHTSLHDVYHNWRGLIDVSQLTHVMNVEWGTFLGLVECFEVQYPTYVTLHLAKHLCGAQVPPEVLRSLRPPRWLEMTLMKTAHIGMYNEGGTALLALVAFSVLAPDTWGKRWLIASELVKRYCSREILSHSLKFGVNG